MSPSDPLIKIASWNVNSLRVRLPHVLEWLKQAEPPVDILAIQETKTEDQNFPEAELKEAGYTLVFSGQKTYNGVAILARHKLEEIATESIFCDTFTDKRVLCVTCCGVRIINLYVVNGGEMDSDKYQYKLEWLDKVYAFLKEQIAAYPHCIVLGDFNIAPADRDVYDPKLFEGKVLCSDPERERLRKIIQLGWVDTFDLFEHPNQRYSWWDYRSGGFEKRQGVRIDLILASTALAEQCLASYIDDAPRAWERPSDHAPAVALFRQPT